MSVEGLVFGLLDTSLAIGDPIVAAKYRGFTVSWSRYGYHDVIIESNCVDDILTKASDRGYRFCFIQSYGHIIRERWIARSGPRHDFHSALEAWIESRDFLVTGSITGSHRTWFGVTPGCLLVNLQEYRRLDAPRFDVACDRQLELPGAVPTVKHGRISSLLSSTDTVFQRPEMPGWNFTAASLRAGVPVLGFEDDLRSHLLDLEATCPARTEAFARYLDGGIAMYRRSSPHGGLTHDQVEFLNVADTQTANARRGVFPWNIESYADVETPRPDFQAPISTLYSVAAGFKPNRILQTHGFDENSKVVYFDYSPHALRVKKCLVEEWDGENFPDFVRYLFKKFPYPETFYQLWEDRTPHDVDDNDLRELWERELDKWRGARPLSDHSRAYRELRHEFICCDILTDAAPLLDQMVTETSAVVWWSNAFFTVYGNWYRTLAERKQGYEQWIERLATINPTLFLFGSDYNNSNVNSIQAGEYWERYRHFDGSDLIPCSLYETEIRM